jgi:hypothetical protein
MGMMAFLFLLFFKNTHHVQTGLPQGVDVLAILFNNISF